MLGRTDQKTASVTCEAKVQGFRVDPNSVDGVPIFYNQIASAGAARGCVRHVSPYAVKEAVFIVNQMLANRPDVLDASNQKWLDGCALCRTRIYNRPTRVRAPCRREFTRRR